MKKSNLLAGLGLALVVVAGSAAAGTPRLNTREANQHARIHQGVQSGELTRPEARACTTKRIASRPASIARNTMPRIAVKSRD